MSKTNNDALIKELMQKVEEQKASLGTRERVVWNTNGLFKFDSNNHFNLNTVSDPAILAGALAFLMQKEEYFYKACNLLGIQGTKFEWESYSVRDWTSDFEVRVRQIEYDKKKKKLDDTKKKLAALVSEEARTEMELESIKESLGL